MAGTKKRKHVSIDESSLQQQTIKDFANVRKAHGTEDVPKKRKTQHCRDVTSPPPNTLKQPERRLKRKLQLEENDVDQDVREADSNRLADTQNAPAAHNKRVKMQPASVQDTPSKSAAAMFNRLELESKTQAIPFALNPKAAQLPDADSRLGDEWPAELEHLAQLNAAFLSALSLYYAHNGTSSPVEVTALLPTVTKHWRKRAVTLEDLRRVLAISGEDEASFKLQDFGRAGICLSKVQPRGRAMKRAASYVDETDLKARFELALQQSWTAWLDRTSKENREVAAFVKQLPLMEISQHDSVEKAAPLFARGHQRLADIKASQAASKSDTIHPITLTPQQNPTTAVQSRGTSLLDRVLAKQALTASLPAGPTKDQLERKAALHRVEDVARVLDLLAAGRPRCSFGLHAVFQHLQQSLRSPISKDEVERCVDLMAKEITPAFVNVVRNGNVVYVVVTKGGKIGLDELRLRVKNALV